MTDILNDCQAEDPINILADECDREARQALGMVPPGHGPVAAHYRKYARAIIEAYAARLRDPATVHANMLHGTIAKNCQGEDPIAMMVERLRESAHGIAAILSCDAKSTYEWRTADVLLSLTQERDRLREALERLITRHAELVESGDCGFWDVEAEPEMIEARAALNKTKPISSEDQQIMQSALRSSVDLIAEGRAKDTPCQET